MNINVVWDGKYKFTGTSADGHKVLMEAGLAGGGEAMGPQPTEMLLMAVGGCTGINIAKILEKMREAPASFAIEVDAGRADTDPKKFTLLRLTFKLTGDVKPASAERAIRLTLDTYCSVANSLSATMTFAYEINGVRYPASGYLE